MVLYRNRSAQADRLTAHKHGERSWLTDGRSAGQVFGQMRHENPTVGEQPTSAEGEQHDGVSVSHDGPAVTESAFEGAGVEATASVVASPNGGHYHLTLGDSDIPRCGARGGTVEMERMTLYRAVEQTDLDRCSRCPW